MDYTVNVILKKFSGKAFNMTYKIISEERGIVFRFSGDVTFNEVNAANQKGWEQPGWRNHQYQIWDFENAESFIITDDQAMALAYMDNIHTELIPLIKVAFISNNEKITAVVDAYFTGIKSEHLVANIFTDEDGARKWLNEGISEEI